MKVSGLGPSTLFELEFKCKTASTLKFAKYKSRYMSLQIQKVLESKYKFFIEFVVFTH